MTATLYKKSTIQTRRRRGGLVVSALDSGSRGSGSSPGRVIVLCSWARQFTLTVPLSTQEYKWVPTTSQGNLKNCDGLASHSGGVAILLVASCYGNRDKLWWRGPLGSYADFIFFIQMFLFQVFGIVLTSYRTQKEHLVRMTDDVITEVT